MPPPRAELLAPATRSEIESSTHQPCVEAWASESVPSGGDVTRVRAYGSMAIVELDADTVFLARFDSGWRVIAAHCAPRARRAVRVPGQGQLMRTVFIVYLAVIVVGLGYFLVLGAQERVRPCAGSSATAVSVSSSG